MPSSPPLTRALVRALVVPVLVLLAVTGYLVTSAALAANTTTSLSDADRPTVTTWKAGYSRQFPGCVASVLWPERETPAAIVLRSRSGEVRRVSTRHATPRLFTRVRHGEAEIIGACYRG